jgi:sorbitol-specific phosphotransferase system component IIA
MVFNTWALFVLFLPCLLLGACAEIKQTGRIIGHTTRDVTREIGHGTRGVVKTIGHGARDATREIGHGTRRVVGNIKDESGDREN